MDALFNSLIAAFIISLFSFVGAITLAIKRKTSKMLMFVLVAFAAGILIGSAFFHLLPEALDISISLDVFVYLIIGFCAFFVLERVLYWRHCHGEKCEVHPFSYLVLVGDGVHNLIDGLIIVSAFIVDAGVGVVTTFAILSHEIPQELGDFAVLVYGGFTNKRALFFNFFSGLLAVAGVVIGYLIAYQIENFALYLLPFAAGGFIYIASSDLIPEIHKEKDKKSSILSFSFFLLGILLMYSAKVFIA